MNQRTILAAGAIVVLVLMLMLQLLSQQNRSCEALDKETKELERVAVEYDALSRHWEAPNTGTKLLVRLKEIQAPAKEQRKGKKIRLVFHKLNGTTLDLLSQALLNSDAVIELFSLEKEAERLTLTTEFRL